MGKTKAFFDKNGSHIATYAGIIFTVATVAEAVRATYKASAKIKKVKEEHQLDKMPFKDVFKLVWKNYIPTASGLTISVVLLILGDRLGEKKRAALMAAYSLSETAFKEFRDTTKEIASEETVKKIEDKINSNKIEKAAVPADATYISGAEQVIVEPITNQKLFGTWNAVLSIANKLNKSCVLHGYGSTIAFNDFLDELKLKNSEIGEDIGWTVDHLIDLEPTCKEVNGVMYVCINYRNKPISL